MFHENTVFDKRANICLSFIEFLQAIQKLQILNYMFIIISLNSK